MWVGTLEFASLIGRVKRGTSPPLAGRGQRPRRRPQTAKSLNKKSAKGVQGLGETNGTFVLDKSFPPLGVGRDILQNSPVDCFGISVYPFGKALNKTVPCKALRQIIYRDCGGKLLFSPTPL